MTLRLSGLTYAEISAELNRTPNTVRDWFNNEPVFRDEFAAATAESIDRARTIIRNAAPDAARNLLALMLSEHQATALGAVKDILDRSGLKPDSKMDVTHAGAVQLDHALDLSGLSDDDLRTLAAISERLAEAE